MPSIDEIITGFNDLISALKEEMQMKDLEIAILTARLDESRMSGPSRNDLIKIVDPVITHSIHTPSVEPFIIKDSERRLRGPVSTDPKNLVTKTCIDCGKEAVYNKYSEPKSPRCKDCRKKVRGDAIRAGKLARLNAITPSTPIDYSGTDYAKN